MAKTTKKDLGLGIRALLNASDVDHQEDRSALVKEVSNTVALIPISQIEVNPFQPRHQFDENLIEELAASIEIHGLIQPITVRYLGQDKYQIISGERRFRASKKAGLKELPAYIRLADDQGLLEMALIENIQRQDLNPLELAMSYQRLMDECQITHEAVADRVSKSRSSVSNYLRLLKLPPAVQTAIRAEKISMGHARTIAGLDDVSLQLLALKTTLEKDLSVRKLEDFVRSLQEDGPKTRYKQSRTNDPHISHIQNEISSELGMPVQLLIQKTGKGRLVIHFDDHEQLQHLIETIRS